MIIDVRVEEIEEVKCFQFDDSEDYIYYDENTECVTFNQGGEIFVLFEIKDYEFFCKACELAYEEGI